MCSGFFAKSGSHNDNDENNNNDVNTVKHIGKHFF